MPIDDAAAIFHTAASPTLQRIKDDAEGKQPRIKGMLEYISENLCSPKLSVNRLKEACGIRDNSVAIHFHAALGAPPHAYISGARMEIAARLLEQTDLAVWKISEGLGYSSIQVFSRSFCQKTGERPTVFRRRVRAEQPPETKPAPMSALAPAPAFDWKALRALLEQDLPARELLTRVNGLVWDYVERRR